MEPRATLREVDKEYIRMFAYLSPKHRREQRALLKGAMLLRVVL